MCRLLQPKGINTKQASHTQQRAWLQRPESPRLTITSHVSKHKVLFFKDGTMHQSTWWSSTAYKFPSLLHKERARKGPKTHTSPATYLWSPHPHRHPAWGCHHCRTSRSWRRRGRSRTACARCSCGSRGPWWWCPPSSCTGRRCSASRSPRTGGRSGCSRTTRTGLFQRCTPHSPGGWKQVRSKFKFTVQLTSPILEPLSHSTASPTPPPPPCTPGGPIPPTWICSISLCQT